MPSVLSERFFLHSFSIQSLVEEEEEEAEEVASGVQNGWEERLLLLLLTAAASSKGPKPYPSLIHITHFLNKTAHDRCLVKVILVVGNYICSHSVT